MLEALTLDQLRIFLAVATQGGFAAAGRELGRAQSAISYAIANLEETLGLELFDRTVKRHISLSLAGEALLEDARRVLGEAELLFERASTLGAGLEPELTLVIDVMFPAHELVSLCVGFNARFAQVRLRVITEAPEAISASVSQRSHAIGVLSATSATSLNEGDDGAELWRVHPLPALELIPVVAAHHPLAQLEAPQPEAQLAQYTRMVSAAMSAMSEDTGALEAEALSLCELQWSVPDVCTLRALIEAGLGWGELPLAMIQGEVERGRLVRLWPEPWAQRHRALPRCAITTRDQAITPALRWLIEQLEARDLNEETNHKPRPRDD